MNEKNKKRAIYFGIAGALILVAVILAVQFFGHKESHPLVGKWRLKGIDGLMTSEGDESHLIFEDSGQMQMLSDEFQYKIVDKNAFHMITDTETIQCEYLIYENQLMLMTYYPDSDPVESIWVKIEP